MVLLKRDILMDRKKDVIKDWFAKEKWSVAVLLIAAVLFLALRLYAADHTEQSAQSGDYAEYEKATVTEIISDTTQKDESSDGAMRGEQKITVRVDSGQYKGEILLADNFVGPLYGVPLKKGDSAVLIINTYANGDLRATVYEYNRTYALFAVLLIFFGITAAVGGKTGLKSFIALMITAAVLFGILIPLLIKGFPTLPAVFAACIYITAVSLTIIGGLHRKTICAMLGTAAGTAFAMLFGIFAQNFCRIDGMRTSDVEPLLQLRQSGVPIGLSGLLTAGIIISALGAVMDVAMSISSSLEEVHAANPSLTTKELFASGMNIGRDMVGTMTNTLILAFIGSGFTLILYLFSLGLSFWQLSSSAYVSVEAISALASSAGMILAIPLTALISSALLSRDHTV